jgi:hypothetical protein
MNRQHYLDLNKLETLSMQLIDLARFVLSALLLVSTALLLALY